MKKLVYVSIMALTTMFLAACGSVEKISIEEPNGGVDSFQYILDGTTATAEDIEWLSQQGMRLFYFMESNQKGDVARVFTNEDDFEAYSHQTQLLEPQLFCISTRAKTKLFDHTNYNADSWAIVKGLSYPNLHIFLQNNPDNPGDTWGDEISSIKMADCVYTTLYQNTNYGGATLRQKGNNLSTMPAGFNNSVSSITVGS